MSTPDLDAHKGPCQCEACRIIDAQDAKDDDLNAWADYNRKPQHELDRLNRQPLVGILPYALLRPLRGNQDT